MLKPIQVRALLDKYSRFVLESQITLHEAVQAIQKAIILEALDQEDGNQARAAKRMGVHRNTLNRDMKVLDIPLKYQERGRPNPQRKWQQKPVDSVAQPVLQTDQTI